MSRPAPSAGQIRADALAAVVTHLRGSVPRGGRAAAAADVSDIGFSFWRAGVPEVAPVCSQEWLHALGRDADSRDYAAYSYIRNKVARALRREGETATLALLRRAWPAKYGAMDEDAVWDAYFRSDDAPARAVELMNADAETLTALARVAVEADLRVYAPMEATTTTQDSTPATPLQSSPQNAPPLPRLPLLEYPPSLADPPPSP